MRWTITILIGLALLTEVGLGSYWYGRHDKATRHADEVATSVNESSQDNDQVIDPPASTQAPVVPVRTVAAKDQIIQQKITAYGTVLAEPGVTHVVSLLFETQISQVLVTPGQSVSMGMPLLVAEPSRNTALQWIDAKNTLAAANDTLKHVRNKFKERLATNAQLLQAQQAQLTAAAKLRSLKQRGVGQSQILKAKVAGVVNQVNVRQGQLVPAGSPLASIVPQHRIEVKLGVEPEDVPYLTIDQPIRLSNVHDENPSWITGHIRLITQQVDLQTRLVNVYVALPSDAHLMLQDFIRARITTASNKGLVVPRKAVLPEQNHYVLFTTHHGHAIKHIVSLGLENDRQVEILSGNVKAGDQVVIVGNYELKEGMRILKENKP